MDLAFNAKGKVAAIAVAEGDRVDAGQVLARLDRDAHKAAVAAAKARLAESRARLDELRAGSRPEEIERAKAAVERAQAVVKQTRATMKRRRKPRSPDYVPEEASDHAVRAYDEARKRAGTAAVAVALEG